MSFEAQQARSFLAPLVGKATVFAVEDRPTNIALAHLILSAIGEAGDACTVFDADALYSSESDKILAGVPAASTQRMALLVPPPGSDVEEEFPKAFDVDAKAVVIDSLNTLYHLLSLGDGGTRGRKFNFAMAILAYLARTENKAVILTMYRRGGFLRSRPSRPISSSADTTVSVEIRDSELLMVCERGKAWPGGRFSIRTP